MASNGASSDAGNGASNGPGDGASKGARREPESLTEAVLGRGISQEPWTRRWMALEPAWRVALASALFAALLFVPYLGAVGLWDPWETHYGEVGREMLQRRDYVFPYWENAWFFSKPPLTMWMQALGMQVVGSLRSEGALGLYTEWGMRLPFALLSIAAVALLALAVARVVGPRAGLATGFVLATMPLYFLLTRQTVTDTPFVTTLTCAMACALLGQLDPTTRHRAAWWYAFYVFAGLSTLAKGLLGVGLPAVILVLYALFAVMPYDGPSLNAHLRWVLERGFRAEVRAGTRPMPVLWAQLYTMKLGTGVLVFCLVAVPWYFALCLFDGVDDEGKLFWYRFFIHDHLNRLSAGVHTTTPGGSFVYFIEQGGFAIFPWVALVPGAFALVSRLRPRSPERKEHLALIAALWVAFSFTLLASSATKFHHYVFPVLPGLAILLGLFVDRLWEEGVAAHAMSLVFGFVLFLLVGHDLANNPKDFTDLFVYNYDRPYPVELVTKPIAMFSSRPLWVGDLLTLVLLSLGAYLALGTLPAKSGASPFSRALTGLFLGLGVACAVPMAARGAVPATPLVGGALLLVGAYVARKAWRAGVESRTGLWSLCALLLMVGGGALARGLSTPVASDGLLKALSEPVNVKMCMGFAFVVAGGVAAVACLLRARVMLFATVWALAAGFALWFNWGHWVDLSHHWTQRDLFWRYYAQRRPDEPIAAFLMNWRGETFYSRNTVKQIRETPKLKPFVDQPGREWALVEHNRLGILRQAVGSEKTVTVIDRDINNKFILVTVD